MRPSTISSLRDSGHDARIPKIFQHVRKSDFSSFKNSPRNFITVIQLTHFSDLIGASHSPAYTEYAVGGYASDGFKELAEWGNTHKMEMEMKEHVSCTFNFLLLTFYVSFRRKKSVRL
jgi:hypothetical protein